MRTSSSSCPNFQPLPVMSSAMSSADVSLAPKESVAGKDLKEMSVKAGSLTTKEGQVLTPNVEYERYLELHNRFDGPPRKKFIRKRMSWLF